MKLIILSKMDVLNYLKKMDLPLFKGRSLPICIRERRELFALCACLIASPFRKKKRINFNCFAPAYCLGLKEHTILFVLFFFFLLSTLLFF